MSSNDTQETVYRTIQEAPGLGNRHVGPLFDDESEAKRAIEHFIETEHNATPTEWEDNDHGVKMIPEDSCSEFLVVPTPVWGSLGVLLDDPDVNDGEEVTAIAD